MFIDIKEGPVINCIANKQQRGYKRLRCYTHRVLGFFSSRLNWDPPTSSPAGESVRSPFSSGGTHSLAGDWVGGGGVSILTRHCGTISIYTSMYFVEITDHFVFAGNRLISHTR
jgi:hypothetical protein